MLIDSRQPPPDQPPPDRPDLTGLLRIENLRIFVHDGAATAVRGVSLEVAPGEIVGLVGESGSGKTLTCRAVLGVLPPGCGIESGAVRFAGRDLTTLSRRQ